MRLDLPPELLAERDRLICEIRSSFEFVVLEGGTSWAHAVALASEGSDEELAALRDPGDELPWTHLVDDPQWIPDHSIGVWGCLNPEGFHFHLPAAMVRALMSGEGSAICWWLTLPFGGDQEIYLQKWNRLDARQQTTVRLFLEHMVWRSATIGEGERHDDWQEALESYWDSVPLFQSRG